MATEVNKTLRASGGDYTLMSTWEATEQTDLVAADQQHTLTCYNDWPTGLSDSCTIAGWGTDATRYIKITVASGHRHNGTPQSGFFMKKSYGTFGIIDCQQAYTVIEYVDVENTGTSGKGIRSLTYDYQTFQNCIAKAVSYAFNSDRITYMYNCLAYDSGSNGFHMTSARQRQIYNCTSVNNAGVGFNCANYSGSSNDARNCVAWNNTGGDYYAGTSAAFDASSTHNASGDTSAPGASAVTGVTSAAFANTATSDYHLSGSGSVLYNAGTTIADFAFDFEGDARPQEGTWDIGVDEWVSSGQMPLTGSIALTGYSPGITYKLLVTSSPGVGAIPVAGYAPSSLGIGYVAPAVGAVPAVGYAPTVSEAGYIAPAYGAVTITPYAPTMTFALTANPPVGAVTITGYNPSASDVKLANTYPELGAIAVTPYQPTVQEIGAVFPGVAAISTIGYAPTLTTTGEVIPATGSVPVVGFAPTAVQAEIVVPYTGSRTLIGFSPTLQIQSTFYPGLGVILFNSYDPFVRGGEIVSPLPGSMGGFYGNAPTVDLDEIAFPRAGNIAVAIGYAPAIITSNTTYWHLSEDGGSTSWTKSFDSEGG